MSNDLEEFLRKAAERRLARQQANANVTPSSSGSTSSSSGNSSSTPLSEQNRPVPTILEPLADNQTRQGLGPKITSHIHPESVLSKSIDQADDRARARVQEQFDHTVSTLDASRPEKKSTKSQSKKSLKQIQKSGSAAAEAISSYEESRNDMTIERAASKMIATGSMMDLLRDPQTLRTAFIASQIFERKF